jgi:hypothetical protein
MIERREAAVITESALGCVFDAALVRTLREDSPLAALGWADADAVVVSDAVAQEAVRRDVTCRLGDAAFTGVATVRDLIDVVQSTAEAGDR